jgi:hypothetical protein
MTHCPPRKPSCPEAEVNDRSNRRQPAYRRPPNKATFGVKPILLSSAGSMVLIVFSDAPDQLGVGNPELFLLALKGLGTWICHSRLLSKPHASTIPMTVNFVN